MKHAPYHFAHIAALYADYLVRPNAWGIVSEFADDVLLDFIMYEGMSQGAIE